MRDNERGKVKESLSETELKRQLFEAKNEAKHWKEKCMTLTQEKATQLKHIETNLMLLESRLLQERNEIQKKLIYQDRCMKDQSGKIDKLTSANQKLLAAMMLLRYQIPTKAIATKVSRDELREQMLEDTAATRQQDTKLSKTLVNGRVRIRGSDLIACRARAYAEQIERSVSERSPRETTSGQTDKKAKAHRSKSLPHGKHTITL